MFWKGVSLKVKKYFIAAVLCQLLLFLLLPGIQAKAAAQREGEEAASWEDKISYEVFFVDEEDFNRRIFNSQRGSVHEGTKLVIRFPKQFIGADGYLWEAVSDSPRVERILPPGTQKIYIGFKKKKKAANPEEGDESGNKLKNWLCAAWEADCAITGRDPAGSPPPDLIMENVEDNDSRIKHLVSMLDDSEWHYFYLIGKNYRPRTQILGTGFDTEYSSAVMEEFFAEGAAYTVVRAGVKRIIKPEYCTHRWEKSHVVPNGCLSQGRETLTCKKCGVEKNILLPALGHLDTDGDSLCDRCKKRAFPQSEGTRIHTELQTSNGPLILNFTCLDSNYLGSGKLLYLSDEVLGPEITGTCFEGEDGYAQSAIRRYFSLGLVNHLSIGTALLQIPWQEQMEGADYAGLMSQDEFETYKDRISGEGGYFLRTLKAEGTIQAVEADGSVVTVQAADNRSYGVRPFILMERPETGEAAESCIWHKGDLQLREIGGKEYLFRCIDEDYSDSQFTHKNTALFLCESVIRSDIDSDASERRLFSFGADNNYKASSVRGWLKDNASDSSFQMAPVYTGVNTAYAGSTGEGRFSQLDASRLKAYAIGFQLLDDRLFCLSVEEALKYRDELWRFDGSPADNPNTQLSPYSGGYYLRTPAYDEDAQGDFCYTDQIYVVDLYQGNIHSARTDSTGIGLRPAFVLLQGGAEQEE